MKKFITSAACMMTLIVAGMGFASCSSADEAEVNPTYDPVAGTVNADFVFNVSTGNSTQSRMTAANTQANLQQVFRGIDNAELFAYKLGTSNDGKHVVTATTADKSYPLGTLLAANTLDPDGDGTSAPKSRRILELSLPVETNTLMFWGKAPKTNETDHHVQGKVSFNASNKDITKHEFALQPILTTEKRNQLAHYEELLVTILDAISNVSYHADAEALVWTVAEGGDGVTKNAAAIDIKWGDILTGSQAATVGAASSLEMGTTSTLSTLTPGTPDELSALGEVSGNAVLAMHKIWQGEVRSGSGPAVRYLLKDLYTAMDKVVKATPTSYNELVIKKMAENVELVLQKVIDSNGDYLTISQIKTNFNKTGLTDVTESLDNFPTSFGLPTGGTQLLCAVTTKTATTSFSATWSYNQAPVGPGPGTVNTSGNLGTFSANTCMYPAELCYFGNSPVHSTDQVKSASEYPDGSGTATGEWLDASNWSGWDKNAHVKSTSRAVAMAQNINYGTALLQTTVAYGADVIKDNNAAIQLSRNNATELDKSIPVTSAGLFELKGIMIGGQEQAMGWNYIAKAASPSFNCVVYDNQIVAPSIPANGTATAPTYTLVWDNYNPTLGAGAQQKVYVALELENKTGNSFWGKDNLIRAGGTFYLIGVLDPENITVSGKTAEQIAADKSLGITWPTNYALPPYDNDGTTLQRRRVFIQDYMTSANFVIGVNSLKSAYVTVPDLRSTQISLGLSVDLKWEEGLSFDNVVLGE